MSEREVVLAFSGGLDTSFCVPWLIEQGYRVVTVLADSGGMSTAQRDEIASRAVELGAFEHITVDIAGDLWEEFVVPLVWSGASFRDQYPMLCSDRYLIVKRSLEICRLRNARYFAHGCTAMGNDQVRFDQTVRSLGDIEIIAPIREIQREGRAVREYEQQYLKDRGISVDAKVGRYTINCNLLGATISGSEIDRFEPPGAETYQLCAARPQWPTEPLRVTITFHRGIATELDGRALNGPDLLAALNDRFGAYGVGRGIYTGDTIIGLKGRIVFECPGLTALISAHRALEEAVATKMQNDFKPTVADQWAALVYRGFFYEPLKRDLEAYLANSQEFVNGMVTLETSGGICQAIAVKSEHILRREGAVYAQTADWTAHEAEGFIKLLGQSSTLSAHINPVSDRHPD